MVNAFVIQMGNKFSCVVNGKQIGKSKHQDYFKYHYNKHDVKALETHIDQFVYVNDAGSVGRIASTLAGSANDRTMAKQAKLAFAALQP